MKFEYYNPVDEKGSCIQRAISKILNKEYNETKQELIELSKRLGYEDYREIEVFEKYLSNHNIVELNQEFTTIKELKLEIERLNRECDTYMEVATRKARRIREAIEYIEKAPKEAKALRFFSFM